MDTNTGDDEAPKDPRALHTLPQGYTEQDFEGNFSFIQKDILIYECRIFTCRW